MKRTYKNSIFIVNRYDGDSITNSEIITSIRKIKKLIHLLVCAGYNENDSTCDSYQVWTKLTDTGIVQFSIKQTLPDCIESLLRKI